MSQSPARMRAKFGYGIDEPLEILALAILGLIAVGAGVASYFYLTGSDLPVARVALIAGPFVGVLLFTLAESLYVGSRSGKMSELRRLVQTIPWGGEELVLDLGCGRGPLSVTAAKRLTSGWAVCLDNWNRRRVSGNSPYSLILNAEIDHVGDKVAPLRGSPVDLPLAQERVDVIISGLGIGHVGGGTEKERMVKEMARVLKKGGRLVLLVSSRSREIAESLEKAGLAEVRIDRFRIGLFPPVQRISARKPFS